MREETINFWQKILDAPQKNVTQKNVTQKNDQTNRRLTVLLCPGFHDEALTAGFVRSLPAFVTAHTVTAFPANPFSTFEHLKYTFQQQPVVAIGFSAGVVGLAGALTIWQQQGGRIAKLIAIDGWGVPIVGIPASRMSHDLLTHWSSLPLDIATEKTDVNFYADPGVDHLMMWGAPEQVIGWQVNGWQVDGWQRPSALTDALHINRKPTTAAAFIGQQLEQCLAASGR